MLKPSSVVLIEPIRCPLCRANLLEAVVCPRCRSDLSNMLKIIETAHFLREEGRTAILEGDFLAAVIYLEKSLVLQESSRARKFLFLADLFNRNNLDSCRGRASQ